MTNNTQPLIQFENVYKKFWNNQVLNGVNLSIHKGKITTVIGKSGVGKSVLLKHIIGLIEQDSGRVLYQGRPLSEMKKPEKTALKKKFSYMFQGTALFDSMTVFDNIALPLDERTTLDKSEIRKRVQDKMQQLDLQNIEDKYPSHLSGGMKKRVALARALVTDPEIVLFDEPTTGLDPIRKNAVHSMISDYQQRFGFTAVVVSHEIPDIFYISQRVAMLDQGRILFEGTSEEIQNVSDPVIQRFIQGLESRHDDLTGMIPLSQEKFKDQMVRLQRIQDVFSLVLLTVENLDRAKGKARYDMAQTALRDFSTKVRKNLRGTDICSRYGLNKLIMVLPHTNIEQAQAVCTKLANRISSSENPPDQSGSELRFSVSAGIAEATKDNLIEDVVANAEDNRKTFCEFKICC
ncbi:MAG: ATP-binding cassette domain-containing protein [Desulfobacterales bacterium]|nr:ATP-binding cassette domain-containing protein [Desulfobacterales bacterium]